MSQKTKQSGFSLVEAMVASVISAITFIGVYSLVGFANNTTKNSMDRQKMQIVANQMLEIIDSDFVNIDNYNMDLSTCTAPTGAQTASFYQYKYKWCQTLNAAVGTPATGDVRKIIVTTSGTSKIVHIVLQSRANKAQIIINNTYVQ